LQFGRGFAVKGVFGWFWWVLARKPVGQRAKLLTDKMAKWPTAVGSRQKTSDYDVSASLPAFFAYFEHGKLL